MKKTYYRVSRNFYENFQIKEVPNVVGETDTMITFENGRKERKETNRDVTVSNFHEADAIRLAFAKNKIAELEVTNAKNLEIIQEMRKLLTQ